MDYLGGANAAALVGGGGHNVGGDLARALAAAAGSAGVVGHAADVAGGGCAHTE